MGFEPTIPVLEQPQTVIAMGDIIMIDLQERESEGVHWVLLVQATVKWQALVNTVMNRRAP
jgi:hypothetical protein